MHLNFGERLDFSKLFKPTSLLSSMTREFIYYSRNAVTAGNMIKDDLKKAGRMDIVCNVIISVFFISNEMRDDIKLHLIFDGPPNAPRHLVLESNKEMPISKKDVANLLKRLLYKCKEVEKREIIPGCFIEKKSFEKVIKNLIEQNVKLFILDKNGENIRDIEIPKDCGFIIGDQDGIPKKEMKNLKKYLEKVSIGPKTYFASQVVAVVNNELDRRNL